MIIGDKEYISRQQRINLFETAGIESEVQLRSNQKKKPTMGILKKVKTRIETFFSQSCDQFIFFSHKHFLASMD